MPPVSLTLSPGTVLQQQYEVVRFLSSGGFGAVYEALDIKVRRPVAIKQMPLTADDLLARRRFDDEAELLAQIYHDSLPRVFLAFQEGDFGYLVMSYIPGFTLREYVEKRAPVCLREHDAFSIILPILDALAYLHDLNPPVFHRDVKPDNIRITPEGQAYLVDFGTAKFRVTDRTATHAKAFSRGFSPYEQYQQDGRTDARSDLYAVGATLYYMFTGSVPVEAVARVPQDKLAPLRMVASSISPAVETMVMRLMQLWPDDRYQRCTDLQDDIRRWLDAYPDDRDDGLGPSPDGSEPRGPRPLPAPTELQTMSQSDTHKSTSLQPRIRETAKLDSTTTSGVGDMAMTTIGTQDPEAILAQLQTDVIVHGPMFSGRVQIMSVKRSGQVVTIAGENLATGKVERKVLRLDELPNLTLEIIGTFDGDANRFRLAIEAMRLGLAYEYDPYFSLSIARVDPLPHQLEAVYDYFLKQPRIRFLLADDPGAGKTIMAGLLIKELKIRGLIKRVLIVTPANLTFQWQREMKDRFRESFEVIRGDVLRSTYGANPWQDKDQVITSISWISRIDDARQSLLRSRWDLVIVDEAHKMSAYSEDKKTLAYQLGEALSDITDHLLLMTATPHKGDPENFSLFLRLLDRDIYGDVQSLRAAMQQQSAPFYLRRVKEALVSFPDPQTGEVKRLFTRRNVRTIPFTISDDEYDFYVALTRYVEEQSIKAASDTSARGRALGFTMAMLQRRFASSIYAARCSLERMRARREKILANPEAYRQEQITRRIPENFDDLTEVEQQEILDELEQVVATVDPQALRQEIAQLGKLIQQARELEARGDVVETKLRTLRERLEREGVFADPKMKLLLFTEHKDTLDYLVQKVRDEWGLSVTTIHGGMAVGDIETPGTRIYAERAFKENCQVMIATEAAGEGINLQFCWLMINYDIPWNPMRLEQRMGRIHRYGQEKDCLILNFVATNTSEGRVLNKLFERIRMIERDLDPQGTGVIFNVLGDVFPANQLERMLRDMYAHNLTEDVIKNRIVEQVDTERFRKITSSALEGLAKRSLNLAAIVGKRAEAKERRLVPEVIRDFFLQTAPLVGVRVQEAGRGERSGTGPLTRAKVGMLFRVQRLSSQLMQLGERLEPRFGKLAREYKQAAFDQEAVKRDPTLEWITPGHPLFEAVREAMLDRAQDDLQRGAIFYELQRTEPVSLDVFSAAVTDGLGHVLERRLFVVECTLDGTMSVRQPQLFLDLLPAPSTTDAPDSSVLPDVDTVRQFLLAHALDELREEVASERKSQIATIERHLHISLNALIDRQQRRFDELLRQQETGDTSPLLAANLKTTEDRLEELNTRLERRSGDFARERYCTIGAIQHHGRAWVLPHPERHTEQLAPLIDEPSIERIAVNAVIAHERARGWVVESVERENRGFDLVARRQGANDLYAAGDVRFIEVKGRAGYGEVALTRNEFRTAERLGEDYWLYVVYNCATQPEVYPINNPARLDWEPVVAVEHYRVSVNRLLAAHKDNNE